MPDEDLPRYMAMDRVFGVGNVVTGQGNIRVSLVHSQKVTKHLIENCMRERNEHIAQSEEQIAKQVDAIEQQIGIIPPLSEQQLGAIEQQVHGLQEKAGYTADYDSWIAKVTPPDLE